VPVVIRYQDKPKRPVWQHGLTVLNGVLRLTGQYRPLLFFGLPGALLVTVGLARGMWVLKRFQSTQQLATGNAIVCVLLFVTGMVLFSTGIILHSVRGLLIDMLHRNGQSSGD